MSSDQPGEQARRFRAYVAACHDENLEPYSWTMWIVYGEPKGPLG